MTKKIVLFVVNNVAFFLSHRFSHAVAAQAEGYDVHVATPVHPAVGEVIVAGMTHHAIPMQRAYAAPVREWETLRALLRLYRSLRPDIVHHVTIKPVLYGSLAARIARVPAVVNAIPGLGYIFIATGVRATLRKQAVLGLYRQALRHPNSRVIFQNPDDLTQFVQAGIVPESRTVLIRGAGVNLQEFAPTPEPSTPVTVVLASRLLGDKGVREFAKAARKLRTRRVAARFILVGEVDPGNPTSLTLSEIQSWVEHGDVEWWGKRTDMPAVFETCHIVCLPSYQEGLPKVLIEAAACGRPIVTTDVPGCREVVRHEKTGLLVPAKTVDPLADALERLITNSELRRQYGQQARVDAEQFSLERVITETLSVYRTVSPPPHANMVPGPKT